KAFQKKQEHDKALEAAGDSLAIRIKLTNFGNSRPRPAFRSTLGEWRWELSESFELMGDLFRELKNAQDARANFGQTLAVRSDLMAENPGNDLWAQGVSVIYTRLGDLDASSDLDAALRNYEKSLDIAARY